MEMQAPTLAIRFTRKNGLPLIRAMVKDKECSLLIDTGCRECKLSKDFYHEIGGSDNMVIEGKTVISLIFSGYTFRIPVLISEIYSQDFIGIVGTRFLHKWKMHVDFDLEMMYSYIPVKHQEWSLVEFAKQYGKMKVNTITDEYDNTILVECMFTNTDGVETRVCVSSALRNYTAERISQEKDKLKVKILRSGKPCLIAPWSDPIDLEN